MVTVMNHNLAQKPRQKAKPMRFWHLAWETSY